VNFDGKYIMSNLLDTTLYNSWLNSFTVTLNPNSTNWSHALASQVGIVSIQSHIQESYELQTLQFKFILVVCRAL
jgi:hypothetical protein